MNTQPEINRSSSSGSKRAPWLVTVAVILLLVVSITATALITFQFTVKTFFPEPQEQYADIEILEGVLKDSAYYTPEYEAMNIAALKAYIEASGDKYAQYYTDEEYAELRAENTGHYVGIGVVVQETEITYNAKDITVVEIIRISRNSPAAQSAALSVGDYIYAVGTDEDTLFVNDIGMDGTTKLIRGEAGTSVSLTVLSKNETGYEEKQVSVERKEVESISVDFFISAVASEVKVGVLRIYQFDLTTPTQLCQAIDALSAQGVKHFVFDLRDNGGGDLWSVVACASYFVKSGDIIMSEENKNGEIEELRAVLRTHTGDYESCSVSALDIGKYAAYEFSVLVNENTASAAELFTAVLRDYELATVVGVNTFGKGSVQSYIPLSSYGMKGVLKVTTSHYFPPCGQGYHGVGITPDVFLELKDDVNIYTAKEEEDNQLVCAIGMVVRPFNPATGNNGN